MNENFNKIIPFNFWEQKRKVGFTRSIYLESLKQFNGSKLIRVLLGQRRVGKSFILRQYINELIINEGVKAKNTFYINKEFTEFDFIRNYKDLENLLAFYHKKFKIKGKVYLFIDEVQQIEQWEKIINSLSQDYTKEYEIFITGSNSDLLSGELSSLLSGRYVEFEILPFSFYEYTDFLDQEKNRKNLLDYLASGALPELFNLKNKESKIHYMSSLKDTILLRDIIQRYHIKDAALLNDIFTYLVNNISNLVSITNIINYFKSKNRKTNYETISNYISYLLQTFVIHQAERFDIKGKDILSGNTKFYLNDLAFKNLLFPSILHGSGYILENYVYTELRRNGFQIFVGAFRAGEVDFVATKNNKTLYIQVCFDFQNPETAKREYKSLLSIKDNYEKWIVTMDEFVLQDYKGIKHYQAWKLEEELKKLEL